MAKTNTGLVAYAKAKIGHPYWYGTFGQISDRALYNAKKKQYPSYYTWPYADNQAGVEPKKQIGVQVFDCIGLIKGYLWSDSVDGKPKYNGSQDVSANGMRGKCTKNGKISTLPEVPGVLLFSQGHVGVYIGGGYAIEARGHKYGVAKTKVKDRGWTSWGYCPWLTYESAPAPKPTPKPSPKPAPKPTAPSYTVGNTYTLDVDLNVREGAGTKYAKKKRSQLSADGKKHAKLGYYAVLKKGTRVTCKAITKDGNDIWMRIPSGWIAAYYDGKKYVK